MQTLLLSVILTLNLQQQLEGGEIGSGPVHLVFSVGGQYTAQKHDKAAGDTLADGTWSVTGETLEVKVASCKGPACKELGQGYKTELDQVGERVMTARTTPPARALASGSYYCRYQGCAQRSGVVVTAHAAKALAVRYLVDFLIDKNRGRDPKSSSERALAGSSWVEPADPNKPGEPTVVWEGTAAGKQDGSSITFCKRDEARARRAAEQVAKDVAELPWIGKLTPKPSADSSCLWDVMLGVGDQVQVPARK